MVGLFQTVNAIWDIRLCFFLPKNRIILDTFGDEKFEALEAANCLHDRLDAVRIDTPSSRRGNLSEILTEVRWELNQAGFEKVKLFVSGGIDENEILKLREFVDGGFGIGTSISSASVIDFSIIYQLSVVVLEESIF